MAQKRFHRHFETPGLPLYWIIIAYIILAWFSPVIGLLALICMIGPVVTSIFKGRWWTTIVGVTLSFIYAPRTWCSFCPMGTISNWVAPKKAPLPKAFTNIHVSSACQMKCKQCARVCPMQLTPYDSRGEAIGYLHPDCLKCGKCTLACPTKIMTLKH